MRRFFVFLLAAVVLAGLLAGCAQTQQPAPAPDASQNQVPGDQAPAPAVEPALKDYFPLTVGSAWYYQGEGNEYASFSRKVVFAEGSRAQIREDTGGTVAASVFETTEEAVTRIYFQGEAYEDKNLLGVQPNDSTVLLKKPLAVGTSWLPPKGGKREIVDLNAAVTVPAGSFEKLVKVKISDENSTMYEYYGRGVGLVKREFISGETRVTSSLESYVIK